jgi:phosphopantetheinyl transferase (holo-ACP synthase)
VELVLRKRGYNDPTQAMENVRRELQKELGSNSVKEIVETEKIRRVHLTLSDEPPFAVAHVILEGGEDEGCHR